MNRITLWVLLSVLSAVQVVQAGETTMIPIKGEINASPEDEIGERMQFTQARDMSENDLANVDDEVMGNEVSEEQAIDEELQDPGLAAKITKEKMTLVDPEAISSSQADCGIVPRDRDSTVRRDAAYPNAARQRSGPSTRCPILGVLQPRDDADYYCFTSGDDGFTWTYLRNLRTRVRGWTRDDLLRDHGSFVYCGF